MVDPTRDMDDIDRQAFVAFSSRPAGLSELIQEAIGIYRSNDSRIEFLPWTELNISGGLIWKKILEAIDQRPFFVADVTALNPNVTYEMGYAIGRRRKIRFVLNRKLKDDHDRSKIGIFDVLGYSEYDSPTELFEIF